MFCSNQAPIASYGGDHFISYCGKLQLSCTRLSRPLKRTSVREPTLSLKTRHCKNKFTYTFDCCMAPTNDFTSSYLITRMVNRHLSVQRHILNGGDGLWTDISFARAPPNDCQIFPLVGVITGIIRYPKHVLLKSSPNSLLWWGPLYIVLWQITTQLYTSVSAPKKNVCSRTDTQSQNTLLQK